MMANLLCAAADEEAEDRPEGPGGDADDELDAVDDDVVRAAAARVAEAEDELEEGEDEVEDEAQEAEDEAEAVAKAKQYLR